MAEPEVSQGGLVTQSLERPLRPGEVSLDELERAFRETAIEVEPVLEKAPAPAAAPVAAKPAAPAKPAKPDAVKAHEKPAEKASDKAVEIAPARAPTKTSAVARAPGDVSPPKANSV